MGAGLAGQTVASQTALGTLNVISQILQFGMPIWLLCRRQIPRDRFGRRAAISVAVLALLSVATMTVAYAANYGDVGPWRYVLNFVAYTLYLLAFVPVVLYCYDTTIWNALLYATSGYTVQNLGTGAGEIVRLALHSALGVELGTFALTGLSTLMVALAIALCYPTFIKRMSDPVRLGSESRGIIGVAALVILVVIANDVVIRGLGNYATTSLPLLLTLRVTHLAVCVFVLYAELETLFNMRLRADMEQAARMAAERERQYELSRQNIDAINMKCHDIRHQIRHLADGVDGGVRVDSGVLQDIAREIDVYDSLVRTGNEALDTILSEKSLLSGQEGITLTCVADGAALDFMPDAEIYAFFGNALDNALRAVRALEDPARRSISLTVRGVGALVSVHVANFCAEEPAFADGMPQSTQADRTTHGFGTRSMRAIVERHGGTVTFATTGSGEGLTFTVDALIPRG